MAEEKKTVAPAATEVKAEAKKPAAKAAAKKPAAKKTAAKTTAKKPAAKKTAAKIVEPKKFVIQNSADESVTYDAIVKKVNKACKDTIKTLDVYVKSEEGKAYYVVNGVVTGSVDLY
ncbi:MAG: DUF6465 family protein [Saccharofermentans sp.]|nr:DUF6465 family protein [Saccharofermentans sp.]